MEEEEDSKRMRTWEDEDELKKVELREDELKENELEEDELKKYLSFPESFVGCSTNIVYGGFCGSFWLPSL